MTAPTTRPSPEGSPTDVRTRNELIWHRSAEALYSKRLEDFLADWQDDGRYEVAYPVPGMPPVVEGKDALRQLFGGFLAAVERAGVHDVHFHQTEDPTVAFVQERMVLDLIDGSRYENRLVLRVTFRDGRLAELLEYYGYREHEALLQRLGLVA